MDSVMGQPSETFYNPNHQLNFSKRSFSQPDQQKGKRRRNSSSDFGRSSGRKKPNLEHHQSYKSVETDSSSDLKSTGLHDINNNEQDEKDDSSGSSNNLLPEVESMSERTIRLGLENISPEDVEMDGHQTVKGDDDIIELKEGIMQASSGMNHHNNFFHQQQHQYQHQQNSNHHPSFLPLHRPHPIAYQQHLALLSKNSSSRSKLISASTNSASSSLPKKTVALSNNHQSNSSSNNKSRKALFNCNQVINYNSKNGSHKKI